MDSYRTILTLCTVLVALPGWSADRYFPGSDQGVMKRLQNAASLGQALGLSGQEDLRILQQHSKGKFKHTRYQQTFNGVPVWGESVAITRDGNGTIRSIQGRVITGLARDLGSTVPTVDPSIALASVHAYLQNRRGPVAELEFRNESVDLVILAKDRVEPRLSYAVSLFADTSDGGHPSRPTIFIDAHTGVVLMEYEGLTHVEAGTGPGGNDKYNVGTDIPPYNYEGLSVGESEGDNGNFSKLDIAALAGDMCQMTNGDVQTFDLNHGTSAATPFIYSCFWNDHESINGAFSPLNDAHFFGGVVFDMYNDWLGEPPLTFPLSMRVHYGTNYENAFWDGSSMTFGDGFSRFYPLVGLDVASHEVSHGYTEQNSGLIYSGQSGGLNEAFSDIAGEAAEYYLLGQNDYKVGAEIFKQSGEALRYMDNPPQDGLSIDHTSQYFNGLDVHYSSGIYNKAFYLLANTPDWDVHSAFVLFATANKTKWTYTTGFDEGLVGIKDAYADLLEVGSPLYADTSIADIEAAFTEVGVPEPPPPPVCDAVTIGTLVNGQSISGLSSSIGQWQCWTLDVPASATDLNVELRNTAKGRNKSGGDADLYVRFAESPQVDPQVPKGTYDCGSYTSNSDESCTISPTSAGSYYIAVYAWREFPSVRLTAAYAPIEAEPPTPPSGDITASATLKGGRNNRFVNLTWDGANGTTVTIHKNGSFFVTTANDEAYKDNLGESGDLYQVCEIGGYTCSNEAIAQ